MSNLAVITARGGSKRIPRKNIKKFCGKPIIAYSIEAALNSGIFDEVMVSTDDKEIAEISIQYGAKVPFYRSAKTSDDYATTRDVLEEVISTYKLEGKEFDYMCCIYPTAPFVTPLKLQKGLSVLKETGADRVEPVVKYECPPQWSVRIDEKGFLNYCYPEQVKVRSQDLEPLFYDAGQFYWYDVKNCFYIEKRILSAATIVLSACEVQDIDDETDWMIAEMKYQIMNERKKNG